MEKRLMMFLAGLFLSIGMALAQTQATGTVTAAEDGAPIIGASIKVVGTKTGTVTVISRWMFLPMQSWKCPTLV